MISQLLIIAAVAALCLGLRSYQHPVPHRLGTFGLLFGVSFLTGWLILGSMWTGAALAAIWILLPWLEILTRARRLRLPVDRELHRRIAPDGETFPSLRELSSEIEEAGFERVDDLGWNYDEHQQFYRVFYQPKSGTEAAICLVEQGDVAFFYLAITSRSRSGSTYLTWNYPFSYGLQLDPALRLNRTGPGANFGEMLAEHRLFLDRERVGVDSILDQTPESLGEQMESDMRRQIAHNLSCGVLKRDGTHLIRYSARGLFFLWVQFLRDLVRLS
ncbi:MAG: hypothetical protein PHC88_15290 [Terrimicrobiaceae bacterium]|nr:hypothetical protein [Terrimicrobiaceae bacterium]